MSKLSVILMFVERKRKLEKELDAINSKLKALVGEEKPRQYVWSHYSRKKLSKSMKAMWARKMSHPIGRIPDAR